MQLHVCVHPYGVYTHTHAVKTSVCGVCHYRQPCVYISEYTDTCEHSISGCAHEDQITYNTTQSQLQRQHICGV